MLIFRYCDFNAVLTSVEPYFALDYSRMADQVTRLGVASFTEFPKILKKFNNAQKNKDSWSTGYHAGTMFKYFADVNFD
jgi:hypothetical protein